ncbi:MAG: hypothetical protein EBR53_02815, partial [Actinobacteria bacterium]|nr:hypothetical protein [Actinomycetota bacterium]
MNLDNEMQILRGADPSADIAGQLRATPDFAARAKAKLMRKLAIGVVAFAVLAIPASFNFLNKTGSNGSQDQIALDATKGGKKDNKKSGKSKKAPAQSTAFVGAPSLELGALSSELVGADQLFRSARDGFSFPNYSGTPTADAIDASTMAALFGKAAVCADPNAATCVMLPGAQSVADQLNTAMANGRCEGLSVLSQRFYDGLDGRPNGVAMTSALQQLSVAKQIGYWWATQVAPTVAANSKSYRSMQPSQIVTELVAGLNSKAGFTLGLYSSAGGHSVTPIAVTKDGDKQNIYVYDNNYPNEIRKIVVNTVSQSWTYGGAGVNASSGGSEWSGTGAGTMDLTAMSSRQGPFRVSLGGTKGLKGTSSMLVITQKGNATSPVGFKLTTRKGVVDSTDPASVAKSGIAIKTFIGAKAGQGAIAYIPVDLSSSKMKIKILGNKSTGAFTMSLMRTGQAGITVTAASNFEVNVNTSTFESNVEVTMPNPTDTASVQISDDAKAVDIALVKGQGVSFTTVIEDGDASIHGSRRVEEPKTSFGVMNWGGTNIFTTNFVSNLKKGEAQIEQLSIDNETGAASRSFFSIPGVKLDNFFIRNLDTNQAPDGGPLDKPNAELIKTIDPVQLPIRAIAGPTTTVAPTTTTIAPTIAADPTPTPTTLAPESIVVTLSAQRVYGDTNSSIKDTDWGMTCVDSNSSATGCSFLTNAMKTAAMSDWLNMSLTLSQTAKVNSYSSETDSDVMSAELKSISGWPSNYSADIIVQLEVLPRPLAITADPQVKTYGDTDPELTFNTIGLVDGDSLTGSLDRAAGENVGTYAINQGTLEASANYVVTFTGADLTISKKALTITANPVSKK